MSHDFGSYDDNEVYDDAHDIESEKEMQADPDPYQECMPPDDVPDTEVAPQPIHYRQPLLSEYFKGGRTTHVAQSRRGKYHQKRRAPNNLMIGMWNPLSIVKTDRTTDISIGLQKLDIVGLIGTQSKISTTFPEHRVEKLPHHYALHFGTDPKAKYSNKSAGVSLLLGHRFSPSSIRRLWFLPRNLGAEVPLSLLFREPVAST